MEFVNDLRKQGEEMLPRTQSDKRGRSPRDLVRERNWGRIYPNGSSS